MKTATIANIILLLTAKGRPRTQEDYDSLTEHGKTFDLYCEPSNEPLTKYTRCFFYNKETNENKDRFEKLQFFCSGDRFVEVLSSIFKEVVQIDVDKFVNKLTIYYKDNIPVSIIRTTLDDLIMGFVTYGIPTKEELREFGEMYDLYRFPSKEPPTEKTVVFWIEKNNRENENQDKLKDLELAYTGKQFIDVFMNGLEQGERISTARLVEAVNFYVEHNTFMNLKR